MATHGNTVAKRKKILVRKRGKKNPGATPRAGPLFSTSTKLSDLQASTLTSDLSLFGPQDFLMLQYSIIKVVVPSFSSPLKATPQGSGAAECRQCQKYTGCRY